MFKRFTGRSRSRSITPVHWRKAAYESRFRPNYQKQISNHLQLNQVDKTVLTASTGSKDSSSKLNESSKRDQKENGDKKEREREWDRDRERDNNKNRDRNGRERRNSRDRLEKG